MDENLQENQRVFELLFKLGQAYLEKGQYDEAIDKFSKLIELGEENATTYINLSKAYVLKEQYDEKAIEAFHKTLKYDPENRVINIILSQIYLANKREDDEAYKIYKRALQHHPKNSTDLAISLIKIDYKNGNFEPARQLAEEMLLAEPGNEELIPYYVYMGWKEEAFDEVAETLKKIHLNQHNLISLRWLVLNYITALKNTNKTKIEYKIEQEDIGYCDNYLKSVNKLERLSDIYIYLSLKKILLSTTSEEVIDKNQSISEYELFLTDNAFSNIWDRGLSKQPLHNQLFNFSQEIWNKIEPLNNKMPTADYNGKQKFTDDQLNQLKTLMIVQINNYNEVLQTPDHVELFTNFDNLLNENLDRSAVISLKRINDGYFIFWNDALKAVAGANKIFKNSYQLYDKKQKLKFQIIVHQRTSIDSKDLLKDLNIIFEAQQLNSDLFYNIATHSHEDVDLSNKICITEPVYDTIKSEKSINTSFLNTITIPEETKSMSIYEILWEDALEKLRLGIVKKINRFHILNEIYLNDAFNSFKAVDTFLDRLVIIKVLRPDFRKIKSSELKKEFLEKARKVGRLHHNNIAIIYDINEDEGFSYIAREYLEGTQLTDLNTLEWRSAIEICIQIGAGLNYAHQMGIIHNRIKPSNIYISESNEIKITDFAIPGFSTPFKDQKNLNLKGVSYASPEQISNKNIDQRSDIYSVGVILYELLTGDNPFYNQDKKKLFNKIINNKPSYITTKNTSIPKKIDAIVSKALAKSPKNRYENIKQFMNELQNFLVEKK